MRAIPKFTLAIETATQKGSASLLENGSEIAFWAGDGQRSVSSELLPQISKLLNTAGITLKDIGLLAVSAGPGSFTGVRIGLSVASGLQAAAGIDSIAVPLPEALFISAREQDEAGPVICLIPSGRSETYWQEFKGDRAVTQPASDKVVEVAEIVLAEKAFCLAAPGLKPEYIEQIESRAGNKVNIANDNLAKYIGSAGIERFLAGESNESALAPLYIKGFNAGQ